MMLHINNLDLHSNNKSASYLAPRIEYGLDSRFIKTILKILLRNEALSSRALD